MPPHRPSADDLALWGKVIASVRPLRGRKHAPAPIAASGRTEFAAALAAPPALRVPPPPARVRPAPPRVAPAANTLDAGWDKRIAKGALSPDVTIDLHGHTLASAHARLEHGLAAAIRHEARVILLITGRPVQDNPRMPPTQRGVIRASVSDWLAVSAYGHQIAAVRNAHPRHGGAGALYLVLRRKREP